jgi:hypothetical protein
VKDLLLASAGMTASPSEQQVLPVGQDDKVEEARKTPIIRCFEGAGFSPAIILANTWGFSHGRMAAET